MDDGNLRRAVGRLLDRFEGSGLLDRLEMSPEDVADGIWLALHLGDGEEPPASQTASGESTDHSTVRIEAGDGADTSTEENSTTPIYGEESVRRQTGPGGVSEGLPFKAPAAPALLDTLELGRALRPLMRKVPSPTREELDEEATVTQIAEWDLWLPATRPERERWLDLELVVEASESAFIWKETVGELQRVFETQGAFRSVRAWSLLPEKNGKLKLIRRHGVGKFGRRQHGHRELIRPDGRGAVIVVSDCTSPAWRDGAVYGWLKDWSESGPTAVLQLFPEWLWESTHLGAGRKLFATAASPGAPNPRLPLENWPAWMLPHRKAALALPAIASDPRLLNGWAKVVSGVSDARVPAFLFDLESVKNRGRMSPAESPGTGAPSAAERVNRFLATASFTAQRLAGMMAAAPVEMPVVNLIRRTLLPEATPVHVAEVYMGGPIASSPAEGGGLTYDFFPGVRRILNEAMASDETTAVLDAISGYIAAEIDRPLRSFRALLALLPQYGEGEREKVLPFARIAVEVLENLGGEYAEFARRVAQNLGNAPPRPPEPGEEPPKRMETFDVAFIKVEDTAEFEFDLATVERRLSKGGGGEWETVKQRRRKVAILEDLGGGVQLELVEIPAGTFQMGSPEDEPQRYDDESPQHEVSVPAFLMGKYPVTQAQWKAVVTRVPTIRRELDPDPSRFKGGDRPVERVSWYDAVEFCARLSKYTGETYRLPSEAEWEYACRAGTTTPFHFGETLTTDLANYDGDYTYNDGSKGKYRGETTPVGHFGVANAFGLYDMHGNVWEWCADPWHDNYEGAPEDGRVWDEANNDNRYQFYEDEELVNLLADDRRRVNRGGSWNNYPWYCRCADRDFNVADYQGINIGFRVLRSPPRTL